MRSQSDHGVDAAEPGELLECRGRRRWHLRAQDRFRPGYRVYFGKDGERIVILLGGSAKKRQSAAIAAAQTAWAEYRRRKRGEEHGKWH